MNSVSAERKQSQNTVDSYQDIYISPCDNITISEGHCALRETNSCRINIYTVIIVISENITNEVAMYFSGNRRHSNNI